jgi:hypothetical protein
VASKAEFQRHSWLQMIQCNAPSGELTGSSVIGGLLHTRATNCMMQTANKLIPLNEVVVTHSKIHNLKESTIPLNLHWYVWQAT